MLDMNNVTEKELKVICLLIIKNSSKRGGISINEVSKKINKRLYSSIGDIDKTIKKLEKEKLIEIKESSSLANIYVISDNGKEKLKKDLNSFGLDEYGFLNFLSNVSPEIGLRYRLYSMESLIFWSAIFYALFNTTLFFFRQGGTWPVIVAFLIMIVSFLCLGVAIGSFARVSISTLERLLEPYEDKYNNLKFSKILNIIYKYHRKIVAVLGLLIAVSVLAFLYLKYPKEIVIPAGLTIVGWLIKFFKKEFFQKN